MTQAESLALFAVRASYDDLSPAAREQIKIRILDALGCAIGALEGGPIGIVREQIVDFGGAPLCNCIAGGKTSPDRAAFYNSALVRYLDFNDAYLAKGETCHPSDNLGAVLAGCEYAGRGGRDLMASLALAYQVQCRLSDVAPVRAKGFDHTVQGSYALAAAVSRALGLDAASTANAIAICGTAFNALRVTRTGALSHWKGMAYPQNAFDCTHAVFLALRGMTGPSQVFEGNKGFMDSIAGPFEIDWSREDLERVTRTIVKKYNAEIHSQTALEGILELMEELRSEGDFDPAEIEAIEVEIFDVAYNIIGGGEEGDKKAVRTKEQADHSLPYMLAAAILDGKVTPEQYLPERIGRNDVQGLLRRIHVHPLEEFSRRFPEEMRCRLDVKLAGGRTLVREKKDYEGFHTRPPRWETAREKFGRLAAPYAGDTLREEIASAVRELETTQAVELTELLKKVKVREERRTAL
jgi:2-methylcitrate dehydratase